MLANAVLRDNAAVAANIDGISTTTVSMRMHELATRGLVAVIQESRKDWGGNSRIIAKYCISEHGIRVLRS